MRAIIFAFCIGIPLSMGLFVRALPAQTSASSQSGSGSPASTSVATAPDKSTPASLSIADAVSLYRSGKWDDAAQEFNSLIAAHPNDAVAYAGLSRAYLKERKIPEAYAAATKAVSLAPASADSHVALGEVYFRQGKLYDAEQEFLAQANVNTTDARAYLGMARMSKANSYYKQANQMIELAYKLDPNDPDIWRERFAFLTSAQVRKAQLNAAEDEGEESEEDVVPPSDNAAVVPTPIKLSDRSCRLVSTVTSMQSNLKMLMNDPTHIAGFGVVVGMNGVRATLRLDTGAGGILVTKGVAEKAGVKRLVDTKVRGIGDKGGARGYIAFADSIQIGDLKFQHCPVEVIEKSPINEADGLIGGDVFEDFLVDIDFPNQKLRLSQLPPIPGADTSQPAGLDSQGNEPRYYNRYVAPEMKSYTPVSRFGHMLLIPTRLNQLPPKLFLLDTGAFGNSISPAAAREVTGVSSDSDTYVRGLSGNVKTVFRANELTLTFGRLRQKNQDMVAFDLSPLSDDTGTEISGILGFSMLAMLEMKIDYRDGLVDLIYDPTRVRLFH